MGDDASKGTEVLSRLKSRAESAFQPSILPCFHHHHPLSARTRWNPRAFERLANTPHREKASVAVRTGVCASVCVCVYVRMYVCIQLYRRCKDSPVIFASLSSSYFYFRSSICLPREDNANLLFGRSAFCVYTYKGTKMDSSAISLVVNVFIYIFS